MPEISIANSKGRDAQVMAESVRIPLRVRWLDWTTMLRRTFAPLIRFGASRGRGERSAKS